MSSFGLDVADDGKARTLRFSGSLTGDEAQRLEDEVSRVTGAVVRGGAARFDFTQVEHADGAAIAVLVRSQAGLRAHGVKVQVEGANAAVEELLDVYSGGALRASMAPRVTADGSLSHLGRRAVGTVKDWLEFFGETVAAAAKALRRPRRQNWAAVLPLMERAGAGAAPMVLVINFFVGVVAAFEYGLVARSFGVTVYAANFVGLSITRELAPLMTAVAVAGRTGASFTAELGTTEVSRQTGALRALGVDPIGFLVLPRMWAIVLTLPLLTLMADAAGMLGGLVVAVRHLDLSGEEYFRQLRSAVAMRDILFGLSKSTAFALAIAFIACRQGLSTWGSTSSVGRRTAATVVSILLATVVIDALFARAS
jgi:phospholipid/cholesterol/gamma-HCH transport system permease protein